MCPQKLVTELEAASSIRKHARCLKIEGVVKLRRARMRIHKLAAPPFVTVYCRYRIHFSETAKVYPLKGGHE